MESDFQGKTLIRLLDINFDIFIPSTQKLCTDIAC